MELVRRADLFDGGVCSVSKPETSLYRWSYDEARENDLFDLYVKPDYFQAVKSEAETTHRFALYRVVGHVHAPAFGKTREDECGPIVFTQTGKDRANRFDAFRPENYPLEGLVLDDTPLLTEKDIVFYDWQRQLIRLEPGAIKRLPRIWNPPVVFGVPFVVVADGQRIYLGAFWTTVSSYMANMPTIVLETYSTYHLPDDVFAIGGGGFVKKGEKLTCPNLDERVAEALRPLGKILADDLNAEEFGLALRGRWKSAYAGDKGDQVMQADFYDDGTVRLVVARGQVEDVLSGIYRVEFEREPCAGQVTLANIVIESERGEFKLSRAHFGAHSRVLPVKGPLLRMDQEPYGVLEKILYSQPPWGQAVEEARVGLVEADQVHGRSDWAYPAGGMILKIEAKFIKPVLPGDEITTGGTVKEKHFHGPGKDY